MIDPFIYTEKAKITSHALVLLKVILCQMKKTKAREKVKKARVRGRRTRQAN